MYLLALITMVVQASQMGSRVIATLLALDLGASKLAIGALIALVGGYLVATAAL